MKLFKKIADPSEALGKIVGAPHMTIVQLQHVSNNLTSGRQAFGTQESSTAETVVDHCGNHFGRPFTGDPLDFTGEEGNPSRCSECLSDHLKALGPLGS